MLGGFASATIINVNTTSMSLTNDSKCGLAEAIVAVNNRAAAYGCPAGTGSDIIQLQAATYATSGELDIARAVTIKGAAQDPALGLATTIAFSGGTAFVVSDSNGAMSVTFQNLYLQGPYAAGSSLAGIWAFSYTGGSTVHVLGCWVGGFSYSGIDANSFNLDVQDSFIFNNDGPNGGGGIFFSGANLTVARSTLENNTVSSYGGGGAIDYEGTGTSSLTAVTIAHNDAPSGGGVLVHAYGGSFKINQSTVAFNSCSDPNTGACGGGLYWAAANAPSSYSMNATIVSNNDHENPVAPTDWHSDDATPVVTNSDILLNSGALYTNGGGNSHMGQDPQLDYDLIKLGGLYRVPLCQMEKTSPILDVLSTLSPAVDARGFVRGVSKTTGLTGSTLFDMGAMEYDPNTETESMVAVRSSGTTGTATGSSYSGGKIYQLKATKAGDYATFFLASQLVDGAPNYNFVAGFVLGPNEGMVQLEISQDRTFATGVTAIGSRVDLYSSSTRTYVRNYNVGIPLDGDNQYYIRLRVTGKNSASTGYAVYSDYVNAILL